MARMNQLIAVWGKNGTGKSTIAVNVAVCLTRNGFKTAVVGANRFYGSIQHYFGMSFTDEESLRRMLIRGNEIAIQPYFKEYELLNGLFLSSLSDADDCTGYRKFGGERSARFLNLVKRSFQCAIIDCEESIEDPMSMLALTLSDRIIYCMKPNLQSVAFTTAHENLVEGLHIEEKITTVMNESRGMSDFSDYKPFSAHADVFQIPYCQDVAMNENSGKPFMLTITPGRKARNYKMAMERFAGKLTEDPAEWEAGQSTVGAEGKADIDEQTIPEQQNEEKPTPERQADESEVAAWHIVNRLPSERRANEQADERADERADEQEAQEQQNIERLPSEQFNEEWRVLELRDGEFVTVFESSRDTQESLMVPKMTVAERLTVETGTTE